VLKSYIYLDVKILMPSETKAFCGCIPAFNGGSCPICGRTARDETPGINALAVRKAYLLIRGLGGSIIREALYERKLNAPALPESCRIAGLSIKLGEDCHLDIMFHSRRKRIRITEIRLEEDDGRLIRGTGSLSTRMDYSQAGTPCLRLKTAADFEIGEEAEVFLTDLRRRIQYLELIPAATGKVPGSARGPGVKASLESMIRCNAFVTLAPYPETPDQWPHGLVKLRNLNSFNFVLKGG